MEYHNSSNLYFINHYSINYLPTEHLIYYHQYNMIDQQTIITCNINHFTITTSNSYVNHQLLVFSFEVLIKLHLIFEFI